MSAEHAAALLALAAIAASLIAFELGHRSGLRHAIAIVAAMPLAPEVQK